MLMQDVFVKSVGVSVHLSLPLERVGAEGARVLGLQAAVFASQHVEGQAKLGREKHFTLKMKKIGFISLRCEREL